jgi:hypothetical protein
MSDVGGEPAAKRPRVGRPHAEIMGNIEAETAVRGKPRQMRDVLLNVGRPERSNEPLAVTLGNQAALLAEAYGTDAGLTIAVIFER